MQRAKEFYHTKHKQTKKERAQSPLIGVRKFNNAVKSLLISKALENVREARVLDLCSGTGGDLGKYKHSKVSSLIMVDIS